MNDTTKTEGLDDPRAIAAAVKAFCDLKSCAWPLCECYGKGGLPKSVKAILAAVRPFVEVAQQAAVSRETLRCAEIARDGALVPPDGGSPSQEECDVADHVCRRILPPHSGGAAGRNDPAGPVQQQGPHMNELLYVLPNGAAVTLSRITQVTPGTYSREAFGPAAYVSLFVGDRSVAQIDFSTGREARDFAATLICDINAARVAGAVSVATALATTVGAADGMTAWQSYAAVFSAEVGDPAVCFDSRDLPADVTAQELGAALAFSITIPAAWLDITPEIARRLFKPVVRKDAALWPLRKRPARCKRRQLRPIAKST